MAFTPDPNNLLLRDRMSRLAAMLQGIAPDPSGLEGLREELRADLRTPRKPSAPAKPLPDAAPVEALSGLAGTRSVSPEPLGGIEPSVLPGQPAAAAKSSKLPAKPSKPRGKPSKLATPLAQPQTGAGLLTPEEVQALRTGQEAPPSTPDAVDSLLRSPGLGAAVPQNALALNDQDLQQLRSAGPPQSGYQVATWAKERGLTFGPQFSAPRAKDEPGTIYNVRQALGDDVYNQVNDIFQKAGVSTFAWTHNVWRESRGNPLAVGDSGKSHGLFQFYEGGMLGPLIKKYGRKRAVEIAQNPVEAARIIAQEARRQGVHTITDPRRQAFEFTRKVERPSAKHVRQVAQELFGKGADSLVSGPQSAAEMRRADEQEIKRTAETQGPNVYDITLRRPIRPRKGMERVGRFAQESLDPLGTAGRDKIVRDFRGLQKAGKIPLSPQLSPEGTPQRAQELAKVNRALRIFDDYRTQQLQAAGQARQNLPEIPADSEEEFKEPPAHFPDSAKRVWRQRQAQLKAQRQNALHARAQVDRDYADRMKSDLILQYAQSRGVTLTPIQEQAIRAAAAWDVYQLTQRPEADKGTVESILVNLGAEALGVAAAPLVMRGAGALGRSAAGQAVTKAMSGVTGRVGAAVGDTAIGRAAGQVANKARGVAIEGTGLSVGDVTQRVGQAANRALRPNAANVSQAIAGGAQQAVTRGALPAYDPNIPQATAKDYITEAITGGAVGYLFGAGTAMAFDLTDAGLRYFISRMREPKGNPREYAITLLRNLADGDVPGQPGARPAEPPGLPGGPKQGGGAAPDANLRAEYEDLLRQREEAFAAADRAQNKRRTAAEIREDERLGFKINRDWSEAQARAIELDRQIEAHPYHEIATGGKQKVAGAQTSRARVKQEPQAGDTVSDSGPKVKQEPAPRPTSRPRATPTPEPEPTPTPARITDRPTPEAMAKNRQQASDLLDPERKARLEQAERRADVAERERDTDPLTGLANRRALDRALPTAEADPNTSVIAFDANNFGQVNKLRSQEAGDALLQKLGNAVRQAAEEHGLGGRVFRRGGDEIVALIPKAKAEAVRKRAEELAGEETFSGKLGDGTEKSVTVSLSGTVGNTFAEADAQLQARKAARKAEQAGPQPKPAPSTPPSTPVSAPPSTPVETPSKTESSGVRARYKENAAKGGLEITFPQKPHPDVISRIKRAGFKWSGKQKLWYAPKTDERAALAKELAGETEQPATKEEGPVFPNGARVFFRAGEDGAVRQGAVKSSAISAAGVRFYTIEDDNGHSWGVGNKLVFADRPAEPAPKPEMTGSIGTRQPATKPTVAPSTEAKETPGATAKPEATRRDAEAAEGGEARTREPRQSDPGALETAPAAPDRPAASRGDTAPVRERSGAADTPGGDARGQARSDVRRGDGDAAAGVGVSARDAGRSEAEPRERPERERPERAERPEPREQSEPVEPRGTNYRIQPSDRIAEGSKRERFQGNLEAIRTLKAIEAEGRLATPEEQRALVRYVGWGGLAQEALQYNWQQEWRGAYEQLSELLTPEEMRSAKGSAPNAHYTSPEVISGIWDAVVRMGADRLNRLRILEPSMGVGHFFGLLPGELRGRAALAGVELDDLTGRIARQLYQRADVQITGFEAAQLPDNFYDLVISNVPFGDYGIADVGYKRSGRGFLTHRIHDYFFARGLDKVRPGGVVAFVTSKGTLDKLDPRVRKYLADRADLVGAIRLPNTAFAKNAFTQVTTDILFLRRRGEGEAPSGPEWVDVAEYRNAQGETMRINQYFADHPEMMLGEMALEGTMYRANEPTLKATEETKTPEGLQAALQRAIQRLPEEVFKPSQATAADSPAYRANIPAPGETKPNGYFFGEDGKLYQKQGAEGVPLNYSADKLARVKAMLGVRDAYRDVLRKQVDPNLSAAEVEQARKRLGTVYDGFVKKYGPIHNAANNTALRGDPDLPVLLSLERWDKKTKTAKKADVFTKRTTAPKSTPTSADSADAALKISLNETGRVDLPRMQSLTGQSEAAILADLGDRLYLDPEGDWTVSDQYLAGNVRHKLRVAENAAKSDPQFNRNVEALQAVQPADLAPEQISARLGTPWVPPKDVEDFAYSLLGNYRDDYKIRYIEPLAQWVVNIPRHYAQTAKATQTWGTPRVDAVELLSLALNQGDPVVYDRGPNDTRVLNRDATAAAQDKLREIQERFKEWVWEDAERGQRLAKLYNEAYNNYVLPRADGSHLELPGIADDVQLRPHQKDVIWRIITTGNTLLAHEVGAGKTFAMIGAAMEMRRLGLARKSMIVVPNHMPAQFEADIYRMYPGAQVLVPEGDAFTPKNRGHFLAQIASGDWDIVVVKYTHFERLPVRPETEERFLNKQADVLRQFIEEFSADKDNKRTVKELEKALKRLDVRLKELRAAPRDAGVTWEDLGVDALFVDEADNFKNLFFPTKMGRVKGVSTSDAKRSFDLFMKSRYVQEKNGGRTVVFATGTPISNSMVEMFTMMRYLMWDDLEARGLTHFDAWATSFAEKRHGMEVGVEGKGYRPVTRLGFDNLPELTTMFRQVADVKTMDMPEMAHISALRPKEIRKAVTVEPSAAYLAYVESLATEAEAFRANPKKFSPATMLTITTRGRKAALDMRLVGGEDDPGSKVNACVAETYRIWKQTAKERGVQVIFSDLGTPTGEGFNVYDDIRDKLVEKGIPREQIKFIHEYDQNKEELFEAAREGTVRVVLGSTEKMGAGTNIQTRLVALHHLDVPWRPRDLRQREGRIIRQGNLNKEATLINYVQQGVRGTAGFDTYMWQTIESKASMVDHAMKGDPNIRSLDDVSEEVTLSPAQMKALASGDPRIQESVEVNAKVEALLRLERSFMSTKRDARWKLQQLEEREIPDLKRRIGDLGRWAQKAAEIDTDHFSVSLKGTTYTKQKEAGEALNALLEKLPRDGEIHPIGKLGPFHLGAMAGERKAEVVKDGKKTTEVETAYQAHYWIDNPFDTRTVMLGDDALGNMRRIVNEMSRVGELASEQERLRRKESDLATFRGEVDKPFARDAELKALLERKAVLDKELDTSNKEAQPVVAEEGEGEGPTQAQLEAAAVAPELSESADRLQLAEARRQQRIQRAQANPEAFLKERRREWDDIRRVDLDGAPVDVFDHGMALSDRDREFIQRNEYLRKVGRAVHVIATQFAKRVLTPQQRARIDKLGLGFAWQGDGYILGMNVPDPHQAGVPFAERPRGIFVDPLVGVEGAGARTSEALAYQITDTLIHELAHMAEAGETPHHRAAMADYTAKLTASGDLDRALRTLARIIEGRDDPSLVTRLLGKEQWSGQLGKSVRAALDEHARWRGRAAARGAVAPDGPHQLPGGRQDGPPARGGGGGNPPAAGRGGGGGAGPEYQQIAPAPGTPGPLRDPDQAKGFRALRWLFQNAGNYLRSLGKGGENLAAALEVAERRAKREAAHDWDDIAQLLKGWTPAEVEQLALFGDGRLAAADAKIVAADPVMRRIMDRARHQAMALGMDVRMGGSWVPHILNEHGRALLRAIDKAASQASGSPYPRRMRQAMEQMVAEGRAVDLDDAAAKLFEWRTEQRRATLPYFERARTMELPNQFYNWDLRTTLSPLLDRAWLTVEAMREWGPRFSGWLPELARISRATSSTTAEKVERWLKYVVGNIESAGPEQKAREFAERVGLYESLRALGGFRPLQLVQNYFQRVTNNPDAGVLLHLRATRDLVPWNRAAEQVKRDLERSGALRAETALTDYDRQIHNRVVNLLLTPFERIERGNHYYTARLAQLRLEHDLGTLLKLQKEHPALKGLRALLTLGERRQSVLWRRLRKSGLSNDQLLDVLRSGRRLTPEEMDLALIKAVEDRQFAQSLAGMPIWWRTNPGLRLAAKFKTFPVKQLNFIWSEVAKEAGKGNFAPLARFLLAAFVAAELYNLSRDLLTGRQDSVTLDAVHGRLSAKDLGKRLKDTLAQGAGVSLWVNLLAGRGDLFDQAVETVGGPVLGTGKNVLTAAERIRQQPRNADLALGELAKQEFGQLRDVEQFAERTRSATAGPRDLTDRLRYARRLSSRLHREQHGAKAIFQSFSESERSLPYREAARRIARGDTDGAARMIERALAGQPWDRLDKLQDGAMSSLTRQGPRGMLSLADWQGLLVQQGPKARDLAALELEWRRRMQAAIQLGFSQAKRRAVEAERRRRAGAGR